MPEVCLPAPPLGAQEKEFAGRVPLDSSLCSSRLPKLSPLQEMAVQQGSR